MSMSMIQGEIAGFGIRQNERESRCINFACLAVLTALIISLRDGTERRSHSKGCLGRIAVFRNRLTGWTTKQSLRKNLLRREFLWRAGGHAGQCSKHYKP